MGSVKDLNVIKDPRTGESGIGRFIFSDRYSVFDWGRMPRDIKDKGKALCITGAWFFDRLKEAGIKTHYIGAVENGRTMGLGELAEPVNEIEVKLYRVLKPELKDESYDYSIYKGEKGNFLIPLEVIYRNMLPAGSSVFRRLDEGSITHEDLGLSEKPSPGQSFPEPLLDVSTKLEPSDRYISWNEAKQMASLSDEELRSIKAILKKVNSIITESAAAMGLENCDGKIELAFDEDRNPVVVDVIGTPDECRFTYEGLPVSKEVARIYYRQTPWFRQVKEAKKKHGINWKENVKDSPPPVPERFNELLSGIYLSFTNGLTGKKWFNTPPLKELLEELKEFIDI